MKLDKEPVTEMEYWQAIKALVDFGWSTSHALADDRIKSTPEAEQDLVNANTIQARLVAEACAKFNVVHPKDVPPLDERGRSPAPEGKIYYGDWYRVKQRQWLSEEYNKQICSACPLSQGLDRFITTNGEIPCSVYPKSMSRLYSEERCGMLDMGGWDRYRLETAIVGRAGTSALNTFKAKETYLRFLKNSQ